MIIDFLTYVLLGIIQGFTEPIPISSSGHLFIFKELFNLNALKDINFESIVNFGSFLAIIIVFRNDIKALLIDFFKFIKTREKKYFNHFKYCLLIAIGTIPAGLVGLLLKDVVEKYSSNLKLIGLALIITAIFLFLIRNLEGKKDDDDISYKDALKIGLFQVVALFPGISRSGATIVGAMFSDLKKATAFKFSFMLYLPISFCTLFLGTKDLIESNLSIELWIYYIAGMIASMIVTLLSVKWFKSILEKGNLIYFVVYCLIAGTLVIIFL